MAAYSVNHAELSSPPNFADRLAAKVLEKKSQVCVGLDPQIGLIPPFLLARQSGDEGSLGLDPSGVAEAFEEFSLAIIEAVEPHAVAIKLQLACFEAYGPAGIGIMWQLAQACARAGLLVIADGKRGDVGPSAALYSAAYLGIPPAAPPGTSPAQLEEHPEETPVLAGFDAMTVNPLFGEDGVRPFLDDCGRYGKGIFFLVRTSNPGGAQLQDLKLADGGLWHEHLARLVNRWGAGLTGNCGYSSAGAVVGATRPEAIGRLRRMMPAAVFLLPGYGAQGAGAADVREAFDAEGLGGLVSASRSIIYAGNGRGFAVEAAAAAERMKKEVWGAVGQQS